MKVESNAENSYRCFLHYFQPSLSDHVSLLAIMCPYVMVVNTVFSVVMIFLPVVL